MISTKIVFLDFDGVIKTPDPIKRFQNIWRPDHMERLKNIAEQTGAAIVVSSYWRIGATRESMERELKQLAPYLHDDHATPVLAGLEMNSPIGRDKEVQLWLDKHTEVTHYAILEDMFDNYRGASAALMERVVWCKHEDGLTPEKGQELLQKLQYTRGRAGWRTFHCQDCNGRWERATRDAMSPSVDACPFCYSDVHPRGGKADTTLLVDASLNLLTQPEDKIITVGVPTD
jgi:hypothetical protein